ncbi:RNA-directed DNA polymerase, eukaryota, reverse transcriptase zinc-binding domain protein [Tanacetum coccineum]
MIAVYAPQDSRNKQILWDFLHHEICKWKGEVIIMGDFNEVRYKADRFGSSFNAHGANLFNSFISAAGLIEVSLGGCRFTWCHKSAKKMSKLDRFLLSENLLVSCPQLNAIILERFLSDHRPILLRENHYDYDPTPFRFFHHWIEMEGFCKLVEDTWKNSPKNVKAQYKKDLEAVDRILNSCQGAEKDIRSRSDIILKLQQCEEIDLLEMAQKAKIKWAVEGDENTKFFHVTNEEIKRAVWECGTDKAPGSNGFTFGFFRQFWYLVEKDVFDAVRYFFSYDDIPRGCKSSFIALIPKFPDANLVKDFRPISLIGSIYKIIAKFLTNRLISVLGGIVNEVQSAFVANRQILDGPFILNELFQWCKAKKKQALIFKVDFEKAYDSVRWDFLDEVLCKFGFGDKWRRWIQCCLHSSRGSIIINGSSTEEFQFGKGLKQGDPLSPFLFILIMESLHLSFQRVVDEGLFHGIKLHDTVNISHLFYADDAVLLANGVSVISLL